jgi:hypothetical protein
MRLGQVRVEVGADGRKSAVICLRGKIPSKKNSLRPGNKPGGPGFRYADGVKAAMVDLQAQVTIQWGRLPAVIHPDYEIRLQVANEAHDRDGMETTILDVLKKAGVIVDDSVKYFNGYRHGPPAVVGTEDQAVIHLRWERER